MKPLAQVAREKYEEIEGGGVVGIDYLFQAVADAVVAAHEARRWQAIESAPKDGTPVGLWDGCERIVDGEWDKQAGAWFGDVMSYGEMYRRKLDPQPTHWAPIPAPPQEVEHGA
jgi:hypothetical protein